jgi:hypothetical protein
MDAMRRVLALAMFSACARTPVDAPPTEAKTPASTPSAETPVAEEPTTPESVPEDPQIAAEPPTAPASSKSLAAIGTPPAWADVLALARTEGLSRPAKAASMVGLGGDRWAAAIRTTDREPGDTGGAWTTHVLVVDATPPLRLMDRRALVSWEDVGTDEPARAPVALFTDDYDGDGMRELLVRFGFTLMLCGIGEVERRELRIYGTKDDGTLRPQVALTLDDRVYFGADTGRESFADRDADGRADLVVTVRSDHEDVDDVNAGKPVRSKHEVVYAYVPAKDEYARAGAKVVKGRSPLDFRIWDTCEEGESPGSADL